MLTLEGVSKEYNLRPVLEDVHLSLESGTVYTLTAPNGSGKTTLLQVMAGLVRPTKGRVLYQSRPVKRADRQHIGVLLQQPMLYGHLTASENLRFFAGLYGQALTLYDCNEWLCRVGLDDVGAERVRTFSKGMKQRLAVARCFLHQPRLLLLDEPFDGLDKHGQQMLASLLQERFEQQATIFVISHRNDEIELPSTSLTLRFGRVMAC